MKNTQFPDGFDQYYEKIYGKRWPSLRESLLSPLYSVPYSDGLIFPYYLDKASVLAAMSLRLPVLDGAPQILDACAAPGGKTLIIATRMDSGIKLLANEPSRERRRRLGAVLDKHLPVTTRNRVTISGFDAAAQGRRLSERGRYNAILLDAPCSSERHVIQNNNALGKWTPARPRFLGKRQWALLSSAFLLLAPGGSLIYSTCSINPEENDQVCLKLLKKYGAGNGCFLDRPDFPEGEETECGRIILPDREHGAGPLYVARFTRGV